MQTGSFECVICFEKYDDENHRRKHLPCGHCFCMQCINKLTISRKEGVGKIILVVVSEFMSEWRTSDVTCVKSVACPLCRNICDIQPAITRSNDGMFDELIY